MDSTPISIDSDTLAAVAQGHYYMPHSVLGAHLNDGILTIRTFRPLADTVSIVTESGEYPALHELNGIWVTAFPSDKVPAYRVRATFGDNSSLTDDPYRHLPTLGEIDTYLISEGRHERLWNVLGAHRLSFTDEIGSVEGVAFAVWAPNAQAVRVIGDFNSWDGRAHSMRSMGASGVWELFIPDVVVGARYKFQICTPDGSWIDKADPLARATEIPPLTASVVTDYFHEWADAEWMEARAHSKPHASPVSIYEVHMGSWKQGLSYRELADELIAYLAITGFTHVELMPIAEFPFGGSWGYQVTSYYAPTSRYGTPDDFRYFVDRLHQAGYGVILDWVPAHFPKDDWALARFDGTPLYEDPNPLRGEHPDWGTLVFNYGRREVRNFLVANALYWLQDFHIDGLRMDAVASMLYLDYSRNDGQWQPNQYGGRENLEAIQFIQEVNATAYKKYPGIMMVAEESTAWPGVTAPTSSGGLGFGLKWNMGWMNDTLQYMREDPINRRWHHGELTFSLVYAFSDQYLLPLSHDEVVHGKGSLIAKLPGDEWQKHAGLRALYAYQWAHPGKQLLFMGQEFAQEQEWNDSNSLDWWLLEHESHAGIQHLVSRLNEIYKAEPALWNDTYTGFEWINASDGDNNVISHIRKGEGSAGEQHLLVCISNFAGNPHENYRVGLPFGGKWEEILNTDSEEFGGSGVTNTGCLSSENVPWDGRGASIELRIPPLGAVWLRPIH